MAADVVNEVFFSFIIILVVIIYGFRGLMFYLRSKKLRFIADERGFTFTKSAFSYPVVEGSINGIKFVYSVYRDYSGVSSRKSSPLKSQLTYEVKSKNFSIHHSFFLKGEVLRKSGFLRWKLSPEGVTIPPSAIEYFKQFTKGADIGSTGSDVTIKSKDLDFERLLQESSMFVNAIKE